MELIVCHTTADFDALGAAVGLAALRPGARIALSGSAEPVVRDFLALYRGEFPLVDLRSVVPTQLTWIGVVDTQRRERLGPAAAWLDLPGVSVTVFDHHPEMYDDIGPAESQVERVGAVATLIVERIRAAQIRLTPAAATVMALGIHADTGSLVFADATPRDAAALAWLMEQGVRQTVLSDHLEAGVSAEQSHLLAQALGAVQVHTVRGRAIAWVLVRPLRYVPGLATLATQLLHLVGSDVFLLGSCAGGDRLTLIARARIGETGFCELFSRLGGGGHVRAAFASLRTPEPLAVIQSVIDQLSQNLPSLPLAGDLMSTPVRTLRPETTIREAQRCLLRYGHSGFPVVNGAGNLIGVICSREVNLALHHGFGHAPVLAYMSKPVVTVDVSATLSDVERLMVDHNIGRLPVMASGALAGIVTRKDVLRHRFRESERAGSTADHATPAAPAASRLELDLLRALPPTLAEVVQRAATVAAERQWKLYLVGGCLRDLMLRTTGAQASLHDLDLVVEGARNGAGVELARVLRPSFPEAELQVHGRYQTAALVWPRSSAGGQRCVDFATARSEFYAFPAAHPEVEASSIYQDLYRRDFTVNAMALRLTEPNRGEVLDFFGGRDDLRAGRIRVLHANSFVEDPTRIFRAIRFAVRFGFVVDPQTDDLIGYALRTGFHQRLGRLKGRPHALQTRLKKELLLIAATSDWLRAFQRLGELGALALIHPAFKSDRALWRRLRLGDRLVVRTRLTVDRPLFRLELLLTGLEPAYRAVVCQNLDLPDSASRRLKALADVEQRLGEALPTCQIASQVGKAVDGIPAELLLLASTDVQRSEFRKLWDYFRRLGSVVMPLRGRDLLALGYPTGRRVGEILHGLRDAVIDGLVSSKEEAIALVLSRYPLPPPQGRDDSLRDRGTGAGSGSDAPSPDGAL
ncbi:MAG: CBS domain-containing protein [Candidatus Schekmanbacteria bacterium]|nr:CBS domain-containing protein [Candidatus Schekmanbacteria bacterium]